jgi:hypothetical protein
MLPLLEAVRCMRRAQKAFFAAKRGTPERLAALKDSRKYEQAVDKLIEENMVPRDPELDF